MLNKIRNHRHAFTLLEVLAAIFISVLIFQFALRGMRSALRRPKMASQSFEAVRLAQNKMVDLELKLKAAMAKYGLDGSLTKESGKFEEPFNNYTWKAEFKEPSLNFDSESLVQFMVSLGMDEEEAKLQIESQKLILDNFNTAIKSNLGELFLEVNWEEFGKKKSYVLVTHIVSPKIKIELKTDGSAE